ncbi:MAG: CBS domain-containing protein [Chloroflexota bacterium]|nr:MAG: CBS domain-containing protein [Chloroflexota bacterium]
MRNIGQSMKREVISISVLGTISEAAALFVEWHIGTLPVVAEGGQLVGILHIRDLLDLVMPSFVRLVEDFDFVRGDFSVFETLLPSSEVAVQPASSVMVPPVSVRASSGLLRSFAIMNSHHLYDIPVVDDDGRLVGIASRVDIGTALLANWRSAAGEGAE